MKPYASAREDRDYLLDYKSIDLSSLEKVDLLDVPVDNVDRDEAVACIMDMVERKDGPHFVFFADPVKLMQIRPGKKHSFIARDSAMILADGAGLPWAAQKQPVACGDVAPLLSCLCAAWAQGAARGVGPGDRLQPSVQSPEHWPQWSRPGVV